MLAIERPKLAVYQAALVLHSNGGHWGPVIRHRVDIRSEAEECLLTVTGFADKPYLCQGLFH